MSATLIIILIPWETSIEFCHSHSDSQSMS